MALFKILKGLSADLGASSSTNSSVTHEGWAYFTSDTGDFYIDITSDSAATIGVNRIPVSKYSAGTGITLTTSGSSKTFSLSSSGATAGSYGPTGNTTGTDAVAITIPQIVVDSYGRVTKAYNRVYTSSDEHVRDTLSTTTKYYVTGTSVGSTGLHTHYFDTGIYATTTAGQLNATSFKVNEEVNLQWNATDQSLDFVFT